MRKADLTKAVEAASAKATQHKGMAEDLQELVEHLTPLMTTIGKLLPDRVKELLEKHSKEV